MSDVCSRYSNLSKTYGKKVLLSLGGATSTYQLYGITDGQKFAGFLCGAFGPQTATWLAQKLAGTFDGPDGQAVEVDGLTLASNSLPTVHLPNPGIMYTNRKSRQF
jgi:chitinase